MSLAILVAAAAVLASAAVVAARAFPAPRPLRDRAVLAGVLGVALPIGYVRGLSLVGSIARGPLFTVTLVAGAAAVVIAGPRARRLAWADARRGGRLALGALTTGSTAPLAWVGLASLGCAAVAAWRFAPWAWDALGYHLPIVNDAIATHSLRTVPTNIPYVNAYPRAVETFFVAVRSLLPSDTWIDFAQAPFGLLGCVATSAFARRCGASPARAAAFGFALLCVPLVMLQLATDYVDVAVASLLGVSVYFATNPELSPADLGAWMLATGLLLGSKPSMPPVVALLAFVVTVRVAFIHGPQFALGFAIAGAIVVLAIGGETYFANFVAHKNPIWPIALDLGPFHFPGEDLAGPLFVQGLPPELVHASWPRRVLVSLFVEPRDYIYDMRLGGLGPLAAWGLLPLAAVAVVRSPRRTWPLLLLAACALASPAAHWMRFALALPIALLALSAIAVTAPRWRVTADIALAVLATIGMVRGLPGLSAGGAGVDGHEELWSTVRGTLAPGETFAYDSSFSLPGQLTCADGRAGAPVYLGNARTADEVDRVLAEGRARVVLAGVSSVTAEAVHRASDGYRLAFRCPLDACDVFVRQGLEPGVAQ